MTGKTCSIVFQEMTALVFGIFMAIVTVGQLFVGLDSILYEEEDQKTSAKTKKIFAFAFIGGWGLFLVIFLLCCAAKLKIQWQIKQHKENKKNLIQHEEDVEKALGFLSDQNKNGKKGLKMAGTRNRLLNKMANQMVKQNKLQKEMLKAYRDTENEKMEEIKKSHNMNDFNFKILMKNESSFKKKKRSRSR